MILDLQHETTVVACTKALTDAVRRGSGRWLAGDEVTFLRAELYNRDRIEKWTYAMDKIAVSRLLIWFEKVAT